MKLLNLLPPHLRLIALMFICLNHPQHIARVEKVSRVTLSEPWQIGDGVVFGSAEWFENIPEVEL